jgi:dihydrofolate reductase
VRKLIAFELVSLDGVIGAPNEWAFSYSDEEMQRENEAGMAASDALLLGRATYEEFASFWPNQPGAHRWWTT